MGAREIIKTKPWPVRAKDWRDQAADRLRQAIRDPSTCGEAVDDLISAAIAKINANFREELAQIRALVHANQEETTYAAVRRLVSERDGLAAKYRDAREKTKDIISDLKARNRGLERELEEARRKSA